MNYLDTSALVKRYIAEPGSEVVERLFIAGEDVVTAKIAYPEVYAALTRRHRNGDLSGRGYREACRQFERDWAGYVRVELYDEILTSARTLIQRHALRGDDAIHLASALSLGRSLEQTTFVAADEGLLRVAKSERLQTLNPEAPPG